MVCFINQKKRSESFRPRLRLGSSVLAGVSWSLSEPAQMHHGTEMGGALPAISSLLKPRGTKETPLQSPFKGKKQRHENEKNKRCRKGCNEVRREAHTKSRGSGADCWSAPLLSECSLTFSASPPHLIHQPSFARLPPPPTERCSTEGAFSFHLIEFAHTPKHEGQQCVRAHLLNGVQHLQPLLSDVFLFLVKE